MAVEQQRSRGQAYMQDADKALKRFSFFDKNQKFEDAVENYTKAGNCFKVAKAWSEGGEAFTKAAEIYVKLGNAYDAATASQEAAGCFKNVNPEDAISSFRQAIGHLTELGKFKQVGKIHQQIAEIYEKESNFDEAVENYTQAADYYTSEGNQSSSKDCLSKTAFLLTTQRGDAEPSVDNYARAAKIFEDMGTNSLENRLLQFHAKGHFMNALLCFMAMGDQVASTQKLEQYKSTDYTFGESRECKFLDKLLKAWHENNADDFTDAAQDFNSIQSLDPWRTSMLVRVKRAITAADADDADLM